MRPRRVDYHSLSRTINEISFIVKTDSSSNGPSMRLSKRYTLLWFYLQYINIKHCTASFEIIRHSVLIVYLILKSDNSGGFYPDHLRIHFENHNESKSLNLNQIVDLLESYDPQIECNYLGIPEEVSSFSELAHFLDEDLKYGFPMTTWLVMALYELEANVIRNGRKLAINYRSQRL